MGKKSSSAASQNGVSSSNAKSNGKAKQKEATSTSTSTSIDDIFAAPKKRKAEPAEPAKESKSKGKNKDKTAGDKPTFSSKEESAGSKPKSTSEPEKKKKKNYSSTKEVVKPPVIEEESSDEDEDFDDDDEWDEEDFEDFSDQDEDEDEDEDEEGTGDKPRKVEEIVDPSSLAEIRKKIEAEKAKTSKLKASLQSKSVKKSGKDKEEDELFADSRGTGPRRKTEEGFLIYKEAELQIDPTAGGTPLCPFDCECCF